MIRYDKDGLTLIGTDADGKEFKRYYMEGAAYNDMETTRDAQFQAIRENITARQNYEKTVDNLQISVDAGHTMPVPPKPLMKSVSDTGDVLYVPFDPPLKDLLPPNVGRPAPNANVIAAPSAPNLTTDQQQQMFAMIKAMFRKAFPDVQ